MPDSMDIKWLILVMYGIIIILGLIVFVVLYNEFNKWKKGRKG